MSRLSMILVALALVVSASGQKISRTYNDVSMSEALKQLNEESRGYTIHFLYNELEDFRVTTVVKNKTLPNAILQMIGFYPIRMTMATDDRAEACEKQRQQIFVECTHKADRRLTGTVVDEGERGVAYANVAVLHPADSTILSGGVTNEGGYFAIPYDSFPTDGGGGRGDVLVRVSYVGYKTAYRLCHQPEAGTIRLRPETYTINGVEVRGERAIVRAEGGHLIYNMPQLLEILPADNAYEALTRIPGVTESGGGLSFAGHSVTLMVNGKPTTLSGEQVAERLRQMPSSMLAKAEVMASAAAKYHVRGMVINVVTRDFAGTNQFATQLQSYFRANRYGYGNAKGTMFYQRGKLGIDAQYAFGYGDAYGQVEHEAHHPLGDKRVDYADKTARKGHVVSHHCRLGMDYAFSKASRLGVAYTGQWASTRATNTSTGVETSVQKSLLHNYLHNVEANWTSAFGLQLSASYTHYENPRTQHLDGRLYETERNLFVDSRQRIGKWLFSADQTHDMGHEWELNYGVEAQLTSNESYQTTRDVNGLALANATSRVDYDERIVDIYAGFSKQITPGLSVEASLGAEQYHAPKWNEWRWYPTMNALWVVDKDNMLNLSFGSQTVFPSYWSTMNNVFYTSAYSEIWGNPDLKPSSQYDLDLTWQLHQRYTFTAFAKYLPNYSVQLAYQPSDRMAVIMKETNFNYMKTGGLQASARFSAGKWLNGTAMVTGTYRHEKSDRFFDLPFDRQRLTAILSSTISIQFTQRYDLRLMLNPSFQSKAIQGVYDINPMFRLNANIRFTSPDKRWSVIAAGQNLTNSRAITRSRLGNQDYTMRVWVEYPNASLTAIYRIGGFKEKKTKAVDTSRMGY